MDPSVRAVLEASRTAHTNAHEFFRDHAGKKKATDAMHMALSHFELGKGFAKRAQEALDKEKE